MLSKATQVLLEFTLAIEVTVTLAYWLLLHDFMMNELEVRGITDPLFAQRIVLIHSVPFVCVASNVVFSNIRFEPSRWWVTLGVAVAFMILNCIVSVIGNSALYYFLPWNTDMLTAFKHAVILVILGTFMHWIVAHCVNMLPALKPGKK